MPQKIPLPKDHGEQSLSKWDPGIAYSLTGPAVHPELGGVSLDSEWFATQGRKLGLNWATGCLLFGLYDVCFNLLLKKNF